MKIFRLLSLLLVVLLASCLNKKKSADTGIPGNESRYVVLAYVTSWGVSTPETSCLTHINYAFGHVADDNKGIRIDNEPRLQMIVGLKKEKPSLKVLLSVGGWGSSRFSEMAANDSIDIDWEYPGSGTAGISFSSADKENFTLLMRDVRQAVGKDKLLTIATAATGRYYDFRAIEPYVDYVNIMAYDMEEAPFHHAALHCSDMTEEWSCEKAVAGHIAGGFPVQRLVLGIPFYGHGTNEAPESLDYRHIISIDSLYSRWDSVAQVPYLVNSKGTVVVNYENAQSIELKCRFLHRQGMLGAMYWDYDSDDEMGTLRHAVYRGVMQLP